MATSKIILVEPESTATVSRMERTIFIEGILREIRTSEETIPPWPCNDCEAIQSASWAGFRWQRRHVDVKRKCTKQKRSRRIGQFEIRAGKINWWLFSWEGSIWNASWAIFRNVWRVSSFGRYASFAVKWQLKAREGESCIEDFWNIIVRGWAVLKL